MKNLAKYIEEVQLQESGDCCKEKSKKKKRKFAPVGADEVKQEEDALTARNTQPAVEEE